jgi:hypothetical protein
MEELKEKRLVAERLATLKKRQHLVRTLLKDYALERPADEVIPGPADVCSMDEFKTIIEDTPEDVEVSEQTFWPAMERLPQLIDEWRAAKDAELVRIINAAASDGSQSKESQSESDRAQLELATTIFQCTSCQRSISYPRILIHSCVHCLRDAWRRPDDPTSKLWQNLDDEPWNSGGDRVIIHKKGRPAARCVVMSCGLDPDTTTAQEMDNLDGRLSCLKCYKETLERWVMTWRTAVRRYVSYLASIG